MSVRVYLPVTSTQLAALVAEGRLPGPVRAHAVTPALRDAWPEADEESWEYAALMAAAATSAASRGPGDRRRRMVVAADVASVEPVDDEDVTLVEVAADVAWRDVAAAHVDTADDAGDDEDLAWFATQEIAELVSDPA
jgi:hypothetical protein